jgi:hypothetical protein
MSAPTVVLQVPQTTSAWLQILVPSLLFALLAPGSVFRIPPAKIGPYRGQWFAPGAVDWKQVIVHTIIFAIVLWLVRALIPGMQ